VLRKRADIVYRHSPKEIRCVPCGYRLEDSKDYKPSARWEMAKREEVRRRKRRSAAKWAKESELQVARPPSDSPEVAGPEDV
jgi:hypothetical protein